MNLGEPGPVTRESLLDYFTQAAKPREHWRVGMEVERMGRDAATGRPIPYAGARASVQTVLEDYLVRRGGDPIQEAEHLIGLIGEWGSITLEPGGQVEWSSRPAMTLDELNRELVAHLTTLDATGDALGIRWLDEAVDPELSVSEMPWMPKARYGIMAPFLGARGKLAHRMMTQSASIQVAFDYADPEDWRRKFLAAALLAPLATALFANSSRVDGRDSGYASFRQAIWDQTDPDRCRLPRIVFEPGFGIENWLDWILEVPTIFRHRARGLVPAGGPPFRELMNLRDCDAIRWEDWETHVSTVFTEVRSYTYIEVRSTDLQPPARAFSVPALWTGLLYDDNALSEVLELCAPWASYETWAEAMNTAARQGLDARVAPWDLRELATRVLTIARRGLAEAACVSDRDAAAAHLDGLARARELSPAG
jgi:glutamate--cysteine ligase